MSDDAALETELADRIEPWLTHMRWRSDYADWRTRRLWQENHQALHLGEVRQYAGELAGREALDLGSGMGGFAVALARDCQAHVTAFDFNPAYNEIARVRARRYHLALPAVTGAGEALPFAGARFEIVTAWDVLEHVRDPRRVVQECARVLRPGGWFFFTAINRWAWHDPHYHLPLINYLPRRLAEGVIVRAARTKQTALQDRQKLSEMHYFTPAALARLLQENGFGRPVDLRAARAAQAARLGRRPWLTRAQRAHLLPVLYWLYRAVLAGTFEFVTRKG